MKRSQYDFNKRYLYHFTTFEAAVKILATNELLFSSVKKLNDINESCGPTIICEGFTEDEIKQTNELLDNYLQLSMTRDKGPKRGFMIPAMWGHYAERGHGACLVFDRENFILGVNALSFYSRDVVYSSVDDLNALVCNKRQNGSIDSFLQDSKDDLFFHKSEDWSYEQEFRVIAISNEVFSIDVSGSIESVILYNRTQREFLESAEYKALSAIRADLNFYRYHTDISNACYLCDIEDKNIVPPLEYNFSKMKIVSD